MKKKYECHDCEIEFVLPPEREPYCPECEGQSVTFEGFVESSLFERTWLKIKPVLNFWFLPWKFFAGRSLKVLNSHILMVLSVAVLLTATWQVSVFSGADTSTIFINFLSVFRNYSAFGALVVNGSRFPEFLPAPLVVFVVLLFIEVAFFEIFNILQWLLGGKASQSRTGLIFSVAVWIPNILLGTFTFIIVRGAALEFWSADLLTAPFVRIAGRIITAWCLYVLIGGCFALPGLDTFSAGFLVPALGVSQFLFGLIVLFVVDRYLFPFLGILPVSAVKNLFEVTLRLVCFPLLNISLINI